MCSFAEAPVAGDLAGVAELLAGSLLRAELEDAAVAMHRVAQDLDLVDAHPHGLLDVDVLAGPDGGQGVQDVPRVERGNGHGVDVIAVQQFAEIVVHGAILVPVVRVHRLLGPFAHRAFDVADGHDLRPGDAHAGAHVPEAHVAHADAAHDDAFARRDAAGAAQGRGGDDQGRGNGSRSALEELTPVHASGHKGRVAFIFARRRPAIPSRLRLKLLILVVVDAVCILL